ncbi:carbohydrate-binding module family 20 domain-containing protein [Pseudomonas gozinkensis]|uniref:carbohydrate-binding module family 20 domain-containing protein n=1 Tax=Pseudomonas gozinkensis TaxID=2774461 RepID=UPI00178807B4|nr:carbohydrate-binding module family 20 domain-containing protein [Pseudomonas gozinkensis]
MFRIRHLLPKVVLLLAMLSLISHAQSTVTFTYFLPVDFQCNNGVTTRGYSVYASGARSELGNWDVTKAVKLTPSAYPTWTGSIQFNGANPGDVVEWKCIIRNETNPSDVQKWQAGANNQVTLAFKPTPTTVGTF